MYAYYIPTYRSVEKISPPGLPTVGPKGSVVRSQAHHGQGGRKWVFNIIFT